MHKIAARLLTTTLLLPPALLAAVTPAESGGLSFVEKYDARDFFPALTRQSAVTVSPDGAHVCGTGEVFDSIAVFARNATSGMLNFVEVKFDDMDGIDGLSRPSAVAVSPDGACVYVTGEQDDAVAVFSRDEATGGLGFVEFKQDGMGGVDGLRRPSSIAVSPDGAHVYVAGRADDAVAIFSRNAPACGLTFMEFVRDGIGGVDGLDGPQAIVLSPDGATLYVASGADDAVAVLSRNQATGPSHSSSSNGKASRAFPGSRRRDPSP